ncbi:Rpn family recombination-promoting nuclease/putative transposase [Candidatus Albibeggiatoa sp. nov. NOAA]|uniref:Rpn family recombination-promoting nuclease/putative transposase n=1 Tax=Candidatus Albibeggiatoa sp. nov. NOAA TaxID=3162724 RepID=UPI0032F5E41F|nr:Rpn family recombination-promoting nuclease/putative transposase [Thiotrichaceae bacterium]
MNDKYINLFTDYGFKKIFGEEPNKDLLIGFLNALLDKQEHITDLTYLKNEQLGRNQGERRAIYDLYCSNDRGEKFIVEIQRVKQQYFKDRSLYYSTFAIQEQARKGDDWKYQLKHVYTIGILDFQFDDNTPEFHHHVQLVEVNTQRIFYDKLTFIYLEIPKFNKALSELKNDYEKWLFAFKNLHKLSDKPIALQDGIFKKLLEAAEITKLDQCSFDEYQDSLKVYWDLKSSMDSYYLDGKKDGEQEKAKQIAINLLKANIDTQLIIAATDLPIDIIEELKNTLGKN